MGGTLTGRAAAVHLARSRAGQSHLAEFRLSIVMAGLDPAIHAFKHPVMREAWVYIMTNRPNGTLYVGVTTNLLRRTWEHREGAIEGFTKQYGLKRLVYYERHESIVLAIQREKNIKHWQRAWKVRLILDNNSGWVDLYESLQ
jgi:putative endonuclease